MNFLSLIKRESFWLWKSPSLLWSFLPLLLLLHLFLIINWVQTGLTVPFAETMWQMMSMGWIFGAKSEIENNLIVSGIIGAYIPMIDEILRLPPKELWSRYLVPFLQAYSCLPLGAVIPPLAVTVLRRDLSHGAYRQLSMNGTNIFLYLLAKLTVITVFSFVLNLVCHGASLALYQQIPARGDFFFFTSTPWLLSHLVAVGFGVWVSIVSWWGCLSTRNGCSEIYIACIAGAVCLNSLILAFYFLGVSTGSLSALAAGLLLSAPLGIMFLWLRMRQPSFILNH